MSRWINEFDNHAFQSQWKNILEFCNQQSVHKDASSTDTLEYARFCKVATYLDGIIKGIDPELVPINVWNSVNSRAADCMGQLNSYKSNNTIGHVQNANTNLDQIHGAISAYAMATGKSSRSMQAAIREYTKAIKRSLENTKTTSKNLTDEIAIQKKKSIEMTNGIENLVEKIEKLGNEYFEDTESVQGLKTRMSILAKNIESWHSDFENYHEKLNGNDDDSETSIVAQIDSSRESALSNSEEVSDLLQNTISKLERLERFYTDVYGKTNDDGEREGGLKQEIYQRREELTEFDEEQKLQYAALKDRIESLLPGATSAGLAKAYNDLKISFDDPIKNYSRIFYGAIAGIFIIALFFAVKSVGWFYIEFMDLNVLAELGSNLVLKLPLLVPLIWLAIFASTRRSESQRLQQEYAHKEALAESYQGFKQQIEELGKEDTALMSQLIESTITTITKNASETLDGRHGDKPPSQEVIEKFTSNAIKNE
ncbi:hypothetical protein [Kordiimonas aquimaris]|uniref:hypothetical protein n=1 Tax=Kordiimonas aquimaris TaxID=707591 RepID=UPI0021D0BDE2|nr:hypothetical protein [Kordiimonas aquimaris]